MHFLHILRVCLLPSASFYRSPTATIVRRGTASEAKRRVAGLARSNPAPSQRAGRRKARWRDVGCRDILW